MTGLTYPLLLTFLTLGQAGQFDFRNEPQPAVDPRMGPMGPVVGGMEHFGWGLSGSKGRHYFFGGTAFADYTVDGRRYVVSMKEEDDAALLPDREQFMYYRELGTGHRWAISKHAGRDGGYAIYFQVYQAPQARADIAAKPRWAPFHNARLIEDSRAGDQRPRIPVGGSAGTERGADPRGFVRPSLTREQYAQDYYGDQQRGWVYVPASEGCCGGW